MSSIHTIAELAEADWTQLTEDQLPAYKSNEFFDLLDALGVALEAFREMPVYQKAVRVGLIEDDEWTSIEVSLPASLRTALWIFVQTWTSRPLTTVAGDSFQIVKIERQTNGRIVTITTEYAPREHRIAGTEIELGCELWLGGAAVTPENIWDGEASTDNAFYIAAILADLEPYLWSFGVTLESFRRFPVYESITRNGTLSNVGSPPAPALGDPWIAPDANPFGVPILDLREAVQDLVSTTTNPATARRFVELRSSNGFQHRGRLPANAIRTSCVLRYPHARPAPPDGRVLIAQDMEDKWDAYQFDGYLYFARSWTDELTFRARIHFTGEEAVVTEIEAKSDAVGGSTNYAIGMVDFLVKRLVYSYLVPFLLPESVPNEPGAIVSYSFHQYGRWAAFATYENTTRLPLPETTGTTADDTMSQHSVVPGGSVGGLGEERLGQRVMDKTLCELVAEYPLPSDNQKIEWRYSHWGKWLGALTTGDVDWARVLTDLRDTQTDDPCWISRKVLEKWAAKDTPHLFLATMVWGFGTTSNGPYKTRKMVETEGFLTSLQNIVETVRQDGAEEGYKKLWIDERSRIHQLGVSYGTKLLYVAGMGSEKTPKPLVYDALVDNALRQLKP